MAVASAVPGASDLGLGGPAQIEDEETRRKRLLAQQQSKLLPNSPPGASSLMTGFSAALPSI